jgi:hypothetical protein
MGVRVRCRCGSRFEVPEEYVQSLVRCKVCGAGVVPADAVPESVQGVRAEGRRGVLRLYVGMLLHPVRTSKHLMYSLSSGEMVAKTLGFYWSGLVVVYLLGPRIAGEGAAVRAGLAGALAATAIATGAQAAAGFCVAAAGHWVTGARRYGDIILAEYFLGGVWFWTLVLPGLVAGALGSGLASLRVLSLWVCVLFLLVVQAIFGCELAKAIVISILAFALELALFFFLFLLGGSMLAD